MITKHCMNSSHFCHQKSSVIHRIGNSFDQLQLHDWKKISTFFIIFSWDPSVWSTLLRETTSNNHQKNKEPRCTWKIKQIEYCYGGWHREPTGQTPRDFMTWYLIGFLPYLQVLKKIEIHPKEMVVKIKGLFF